VKTVYIFLTNCLAAAIRRRGCWRTIDGDILWL